MMKVSLNIIDDHLIFILKVINKDKLEDIKQNNPTIDNDWANDQFNYVDDLLNAEIKNRNISNVNIDQIFISNADREEAVELFTAIFKSINMEYAFYRISYYRF